MINTSEDSANLFNNIYFASAYGTIKARQKLRNFM